MKWKHWALMPHFPSLIFPLLLGSAVLPNPHPYPSPSLIPPPTPTSAKSALHPLHLVQGLPHLSPLEWPGFTLLPGSLELAVVAHHLPSPHSTLTTTSNPGQPSQSSPRTAGRRTLLEKEQDRLPKPTGPHTGCLLRDNRLFSLFLIFVPSVPSLRNAG